MIIIFKCTWHFNYCLFCIALAQMFVKKIIKFRKGWLIRAYRTEWMIKCNFTWYDVFLLGKTAKCRRVSVINFLMANNNWEQIFWQLYYAKGIVSDRLKTRFQFCNTDIQKYIKRKRNKIIQITFGLCK